MASSLQLALEVTESDVHLPVIDFSQFQQDFDFDAQQFNYHPLVATVREACKEWGFFRVVNHGIPRDLLQRVESLTRELFSMPTEAKDRATTSNPGQSYFRWPVLPPTYETFCFPDSLNSDSLEETCTKIWPGQGNTNFCEAIRTYSLSLYNLAEKIIKIILASLGLDAKSYYLSDFQSCKANMRINNYSSHGKSNGEEALLAHADVGCLTILYQDNMGGLEIQSKERKWFNVKPHCNSFIVNVGDSLKAWSNGRYRSAEHRVVYKGWRERVSIGLFYVFPDDAEIWAPVELVDEDNPRRYNPFIFWQFRDEIQNNQADKDKANALQRFAGI